MWRRMPETEARPGEQEGVAGRTRGAGPRHAMRPRAGARRRLAWIGAGLAVALLGLGWAATATVPEVVQGRGMVLPAAAPADLARLAAAEARLAEAERRRDAGPDAPATGPAAAIARARLDAARAEEAEIRMLAAAGLLPPDRLLHARLQVFLARAALGAAGEGPGGSGDAAASRGAAEARVAEAAREVDSLRARLATATATGRRAVVYVTDRRAGRRLAPGLPAMVSLEGGDEARAPLSGTVTQVGAAGADAPGLQAAAADGPRPLAVEIALADAPGPPPPDGTPAEAVVTIGRAGLIGLTLRRWFGDPEGDGAPGEPATAGTAAAPDAVPPLGRGS